MTFEECVKSLHEGSIITFKEYTYDRHEHKKLSLSIENGMVTAVFEANKTLPRDVLEQYYGTEREDIEYLQLATMNCPRIVVGLGLNENNEMNVKILVLNKDFYEMGLQEIEVTNELDPQNLMEEPNYVMMQGGWM